MRVKSIRTKAQSSIILSNYTLICGEVGDFPHHSSVGKTVSKKVKLSEGSTEIMLGNYPGADQLSGCAGCFKESFPSVMCWDTIRSVHSAFRNTEKKKKSPCLRRFPKSGTHAALSKDDMPQKFNHLGQQSTPNSDEVDFFFFAPVGLSDRHSSSRFQNDKLFMSHSHQVHH